MPSGNEFSLNYEGNPDRARPGSSLISSNENAMTIPEIQLAFASNDASGFVPIETEAERQANERVWQHMLNTYTSLGAGSKDAGFTDDI